MEDCKNINYPPFWVQSFYIRCAPILGGKDKTLAYGIKSIVFAPLSQIQHSLTSCARHNLSGNTRDRNNMKIPNKIVIFKVYKIRSIYNKKGEYYYEQDKYCYIIKEGS